MLCGAALPYFPAMRCFARPHLRTALAVALIAGASAIALPIKGKSAPGTQGTYKARIRGGLEGRGTVLVSPLGVTMLGQVKDKANGRKVVFLTTTLVLQNGRFSGTGLAGLKHLKVEGRVEPADGTLIKTQRVFCTLSDGTDATRIVATK